MKKKYLPLILLTASLASTLASGQVNHVPSYEMNPRSSLLKIAVDDGFKNGWLRIKDSVSITPAIFISRYSTELGLTNSDVLTPVDTVVDLQKNVHIKYKQYHKGIPVMGADYTIHLKNGRVYQVNGKIAESLNIDTKPVISKNSAFQASVASYMKSGSQHKRSLSVTADKLSEQPKLTIVKNYNASYSGRDWHLAWQVPVGTSSAILADVYIDAISGETINTLERSIPLLSPTRVPYKDNVKIEQPTRLISYKLPPSATATFYPIHQRYLAGLSEQTFNSKRSTLDNKYYTSTEAFVGGTWHWVAEAWYVGANYGIHSYPNGYRGTSYTTDFGTQFGLATTAVWIGSKYFDYLVYNYGRKGIMINSNDYKIGRIMVGASDDDVRYVHEADNLPYYHIGSVNGISMVTIDVIGHEITHALVKKTAGLIYQYESGALNESIADIMGTMLERYMLPNNWNWTLGEDAVTIRDMRTPEIYSQPSRFEGPGWESPGNCPFPFLGNDYCWVHTNSGVMNKWFHLVSTGGTFNGQNVNAIGPHAAQQIVYWALANYLQSQSTYSDARWSTMAAARDIYGECSNEHRAVIAAWNAVNVISPVCPGSGGRIAAEQIENSAESIMKVYPNPATDFVTIQLFDPITTVDLQLYDMTGKVIKAWNTKESTITFATKGLVPKIYTLKAQTPKGIYTHKVIINQ